jgi:hypothetical protein
MEINNDQQMNHSTAHNSRKVNVGIDDVRKQSMQAEKSIDIVEMLLVLNHTLFFVWNLIINRGPVYLSTYTLFHQ